MDKLAKKLARYLVVPAASFMMAFTVYAAPTTAIDYAKEELTVGGTPAGAEYSFNKSSWVPLLGTKIDVSTLMGRTIYLREIGKTTSTDITTLAIPKRPLAPTTVGFKPDATGAGPASDYLTALDVHEYKVDNLEWHVGTATTGIVVGEAEKLGANFSVRKAAQANIAFASAPTTVVVTKRAVPPTVAYDDKKDTITIKKGQEFRVSTTGTWYAPAVDFVIARATATGSVSAVSCTSGDLADLIEDGVTRKFVYVRTKGTASKSASDVAKVQFPDAVTTAPTAAMDIDNEKITDVSSVMEYRVLTKAQVDAVPTYSTPAWTPVTGSEINLANVFTAFSESNANNVKEQIQIRYKAKPAVGKVIATPASTEQVIKIAKRADVPAATTSTITFDYSSFENEKIAVVATAQYKIGATGEWTTGLGLADTTTKVAEYFPSTGSTSIYLRTKATSAGSPVVYTPASKELKDSFIALAARPKAPSAKFVTVDKDGGKITNVVANAVEMKDTGNYGTLTATETVILGALDTSRDVKIRVLPVSYAPGSKMPVPYSEDQILTCEFLTRVTEIAGTIVSTPSVLTGLGGTAVTQVSFPNYTFTGTKGASPALTYDFGAPLPAGFTKGTNITISTAGAIAVPASKTIPAGTHLIPIVVTYKDLTQTAGVTFTQDITVTITRPLGAAITGIGTAATVIQIGGTARTALAVAEAGAVFTSSDTNVATIASGLITPVAAGTTTISYEATSGNVNSITVTVYPAAITLNPEYPATLAAPLTALPTNAAVIAAAAGSNDVAFVSTATGNATVNAVTGELTKAGTGGATTVTLTIKNLTTGQITHTGTSGTITVS